MDLSNTNKVIAGPADRKEGEISRKDKIRGKEPGNVRKQTRKGKSLINKRTSRSCACRSAEVRTETSILSSTRRRMHQKRVLRSSVREARTASGMAERTRPTVQKKKQIKKKVVAARKREVSNAEGSGISGRVSRGNVSVHHGRTGRNSETNRRSATARDVAEAKKQKTRSQKITTLESQAGQSSRSQVEEISAAGPSVQREVRTASQRRIRPTQTIASRRSSRTRSETVTNAEMMEREPPAEETVNVEAVHVGREEVAVTEQSENVGEFDGSDGMTVDVRMARREFMREMELVGREIGRLVEVVGRDFIREMEEAEREAGREARETARGFQVVLRDARRMLEERVTDIANQMIANVSSSSPQNQNDLSRSELWSRATSVLRDARHSEELGTWIADAILGVGLGGLSETDINRLPTWNYSSAASRKASVGNRSVSKKCQICLSAYKGGNLIRTLPCFHDFHATCVDKWLKSSRTCPSCRYEVSFDDE